MRAGRTSRGKALGRFQTQGTKLRSEGIEGGARESGEGDGRGDGQQLGAAGGGFQAAGQETREILSGEQGRQRNFVARDLGGRWSAASLVTRTVSSMGRMPVM